MTNMIPLVLAVATIFLILVVNEAWWRTHKVHGEFSRKFVHIVVGAFVAFWPYFLSPTQIRILSIALLAVVLFSKYFKVFKAIHSVERMSFGEVGFALVVGGLAFIVPEHPHIYTAALLMMSVADGLAAVVGTRYGKGNSYKVFGCTKSIAGSAAFFMAACTILVGYIVCTPDALSVAMIVPIALIATALENAAVHGLDNLLVPSVVAAMLLWLA